MRDLITRQRQILTFLVVGGLSAAIDVGLMKLLLMQGMGVVAATSIAFVAGLCFNLSCHARYTFDSALDGATVARYLCVVALNYAITLACVSAAVALGIGALAGKIVSLFIVPINGFLFGKYWIFRPRTAAPE